MDKNILENQPETQALVDSTERFDSKGSVDQTLIQGLEALLIVATQPLETVMLADILEAPKENIEATCAHLAKEYERNNRGFVLRKIGAAWRIYSHPNMKDLISKYVLQGKNNSLSRAALETLSIVIFKQPITRSEIGEIRGVNPDGAVSTLLNKGLIEEVGRKDVPGMPILYGTTMECLEQLGIESIEDIPALHTFAPKGAAPPEPPKGEYRGARQSIDIADSAKAEELADFEDILSRADKALRALKEDESEDN